MPNKWSAAIAVVICGTVILLASWVRAEWHSMASETACENMAEVARKSAMVAVDVANGVKRKRSKQ